MPIDLASVDWLYVVVLAVLVFIAALVGNLLSFRHAGIGAVLTAAVFAGLFVFWTYYPHRVPLLPRTLRVEKAAAPAASTPAPAPAPTASGPPKNPVRDITPQNPVTDITPPANPAPPPSSPPASPAR